MASSGCAYRIRTPPGPGKPSTSFCFVSRVSPVGEPGLFFSSSPSLRATRRHPDQHPDGAVVRIGACGVLRASDDERPLRRRWLWVTGLLPYGCLHLEADFA